MGIDVMLFIVDIGVFGLYLVGKFRVVAGLCEQKQVLQSRSRGARPVV